MPVVQFVFSIQLRISIIWLRSLCFGTVTVPERYASGWGISQNPILVMTPKLDCENMPSIHGPKPYLYCCHVFDPGIAPMPVRMMSPFARTTSIPQCESK